MKNTAINTLKYTGIVTLSQYIGNKKVKIAQVHNEGRDSLFDFFSECLVGNFDTARLNRPTKVMLLTADEEKDSAGNVISTSYSRVSDFIYLMSKPEKEHVSGRSVVRYSFIISRDILQSSNFSHIGLYTETAKLDDYENFAAVCKFGSNLQTITAASTLVVDWQLIISNGPEVI